MFEGIPLTETVSSSSSTCSSSSVPSPSPPSVLSPSPSITITSPECHDDAWKDLSEWCTSSIDQGPNYKDLIRRVKLLEGDEVTRPKAAYLRSSILCKVHNMLTSENPSLPPPAITIYFSNEILCEFKAMLTSKATSKQAIRSARMILALAKTQLELEAPGRPSPAFAKTMKLFRSAVLMSPKDSDACRQVLPVAISILAEELRVFDGAEDEDLQKARRVHDELWEIFLSGYLEVSPASRRLSLVIQMTDALLSSFPPDNAIPATPLAWLFRVFPSKKGYFGPKRKRKRKEKKEKGER
ncbi:hypothetical protein SISSUDRAFT_732368 [Sistotremastrum suecicum HHB10207 ss-3]|uniref:Uncharacterized protein n=1 Tax=Sistotremastrum suecicum HHB10207 ss-3 TaxID=1314776 RepID=A0A165WQC3_9AGAM|nr:hypothetical protein SISSUDRAFT_732368 [Sistotremastrum suecicum HHB10207 ss-3]